VGLVDILKRYSDFGSTYGVLILVKYTTTAAVDEGVRSDQGYLKH
jgi:hypothetical protein